MLFLNDILATVGVDARRCTVMLHTPKEPNFRRLLPSIFENRRSLFETYQSSHHGPATATLRGRPLTVPFIGLGDGTLGLAGVYGVGEMEPRSAVWQDQNADIAALRRDYGLDYPAREGQVFFNLHRTDHLADLIGRLIIAPKLTRAYVRLAETLNAEVVELARESRFDPPLQSWRKLTLTGPDVRALGPAQRSRLREWRGIYLIVDESDGQRYVGSAYGAENLLGRWLAHVARDSGVTRQLARRDPARFRFSILERVSPDMPAEDVIALEQTWMDRLHTRRYGLNA